MTQWACKTGPRRQHIGDDAETAPFGAVSGAGSKGRTVERRSNLTIHRG